MRLEQIYREVTQIRHLNGNVGRVLRVESFCLTGHRICSSQRAVFTKMTGQFYPLKATQGAHACLWSKLPQLEVKSYQKTYLPVILVKTALVDKAFYP
jgi:hypothetical protein